MMNSDSYISRTIARRSWKWIDTRTLKLNVYADWNDFVLLSDIKDIPEYQKVFEYLCGLYSNLWTKPNTIGILTNRLRFYIENGVEKQQKQNEIWDNEIKRLMGDYKETRTFDIGEKKIGDEEDINFDKFLYARQTDLYQQDILDKIKQIQKMKTPFENVINQITTQLFIPHQKGLDEIIGGKI